MIHALFRSSALIYHCHCLYVPVWIRYHKLALILLRCYYGVDDDDDGVQSEGMWSITTTCTAALEHGLTHFAMAFVLKCVASYKRSILQRKQRSELPWNRAASTEGDAAKYSFNPKHESLEKKVKGNKKRYQIRVRGYLTDQCSRT